MAQHVRTEEFAKGLGRLRLAHYGHCHVEDAAGNHIWSGWAESDMQAEALARGCNPHSIASSEPLTVVFDW